MEQQTIQALNEVLKGEQMAIQSYSQFIREVKNPEIKETFKEIQNDHNRHMEKISQRILDLGGRPSYGTGLAGLMADAKHGIESMKERKDHEIVREAFEGEDKGVTAVEKLRQGKLDDESMKLIHSLMDTEHQHIKTLEKLIQKKELQ